MNRVIALACLIVALAGFGWTYERVNTISGRIKLLSAEVERLTPPAKPESDRIPIREFMIRSQMAQATSPIVFVGDSITEAALLPSKICGHDVINAGIGGMRAVSYGNLAKDVLQPSAATVVALGTNDASPGNTTFRDAYETLLDKIPTKNFILVAAPPMSDSGASHQLDATQIDPINAIISDIAAKRGAPYVHQQFPEGVSTVDGVHLSAKGYQQWLPPILDALHQQLGCPDAKVR